MMIMKGVVIVLLFQEPKNASKINLQRKSIECLSFLYRSPFLFWSFIIFFSRKKKYKVFTLKYKVAYFQNWTQKAIHC